MKQVLRTAHQEAAKDWILQQLDEKSVSKLLFLLSVLLYRNKKWREKKGVIYFTV